MSGQFASLVGWYFLPGLVTGWIQTALYTIFIRAGDPKPAPGTPRYVQDRRKIQIFVILAYLLYTIVDADYALQQSGNFYTGLGVPLDVTSKGIQSRFRRLAAQYHPDKVPASQQPAVEALFVQLNVARDTLADPIRRFAYDRFGPEILGWQSCKTIRDFVLLGVRSTAVYYFGTAVALVITSILGYLQTGKFWRYFVLASMFMIELHAVTRPTFPALLSQVINPLLSGTRLRPPLLPFELLILLRKLAITIFIAISQLAPLFKTPDSQGADGDAVTSQQVDYVNKLAMTTDQELSRIFGLELMQYGVGADSTNALRASLRDWLVQNTIRNDPEVRAAMARSFERRRAAAG